MEKSEPNNSAQKSEPNSPQYKTTDLYFAAYLSVAGCQLLRTEKANNKTTFVLDTSLANFDSLRNGWYSSQGKVAALPYATTLKNLKAACHA
jgi:hypothetical protein